MALLRVDNLSSWLLGVLGLREVIRADGEETESASGRSLEGFEQGIASLHLYCTRFFGHEVDDIHAATTAATRS
jgi:hypothetical protein